MENSADRNEILQRMVCPPGSQKKTKEKEEEEEIFEQLRDGLSLERWKSRVKSWVSLMNDTTRAQNQKTNGSLVHATGRLVAVCSVHLWIGRS